MAGIVHSHKDIKAAFFYIHCDLFCVAPGLPTYKSILQHNKKLYSLWPLPADLNSNPKRPTANIQQNMFVPFCLNSMK
jgi:hypothetical protein